MDRREFLISTSTALAAGLLAPSAWARPPLEIDVRDFSTPDLAKADKPLNILFLGGTNFVGPPTVQRFLDRGHNVTLFNRGKTNSFLFPELEKLRGNRYPARGNGLSALIGNRSWDVVIDTWRQNPLAVDATVSLLKDRVKHYIYVSSIAVYGNNNYENVSPIDEHTPLPEVTRPTNMDEDIGYRRSKILADQSILNMENQGITVRAHGIYGYYMGDDTDGQAYWPVRVDRGGDILCPGDGDDGFQFIDVLDLANFLAHLSENGGYGAYNACDRLLFRELLTRLQGIATEASQLHWVPESILGQEGIRPFSNLPGWVPRSRGPGFHNISDQRALSAGLEYRKMEDTFQRVTDGLYARKGKDFTFGTPILSDLESYRVLSKHGFIESIK